MGDKGISLSWKNKKIRLENIRKQGGTGVALLCYFLFGGMGNDWLRFSNWQNLRFHYTGDLLHQPVCDVVWAHTRAVQFSQKM